VPEGALESVRLSLADDEQKAREQLDDAFDRFEHEQPCLSAHIGDLLGEPLDETALALGYFLVLAIWLSFDRAHGTQIEQVSAESIAATQTLLTLDEELRRADSTESLDTDDVIGMEQPALLEFVHEHMSATLEAHAAHIDVDDVDAIYRVVLVEILALSYAVHRPAGYPVGRIEIQA
jgi:hypothetical protein